MQTKFSIIDYTVDPLGVTTEIPEPYKWDSIVIKLMRHNKYHGFVDLITDKDEGLAQFEFEEEAMNILKTAYDNFGIQAQVKLKVEYACSETDAWLTLYEGFFAFDFYKEHCSDRCYVTVNVETSTCYMAINNRMSQKVDLASLKSFDSDTDNLTPYDNLNKEIMLVPKPIKYFNDWEMTVPKTKTITDNIAGVTTADTAVITFAFDWDKQNNTEIEMSDPTEYVNIYRGTGTYYANTLVYDGLIKFSPVSKLNCTGTYVLEINLEGDFFMYSTATWIATACNIDLRVFKKGETSASTIITLQSFSIGPTALPPSGVISIHTTETLTLSQDDRIYLSFDIVDFQYTTSPVAFSLDFNFTTATLKVESVSVCQKSKAEVSLVNETLSRIVESYTNDCIRVYSDYFGRTDAQPYSSLETGCGGKEALTNGLKIRQYTMQDGNKPSLTLSMQDVMEGLNAIHNIGMGLEPDPLRIGSYMLRVEPMEYFYDSSIIFTAEKVFTIERETLPSNFIANFTVGYQKWEAERINGIDEIQAKRSYRTVLSQVKNTFEQISKFIASGYAIEVTRREIGGTTKDWRYDNDTFIICLTDKLTSYVVFSNPGSDHQIEIYGAFDGQINTGDQLVFTNTVSNNTTYTVSSVTFAGGSFGVVVLVTSSVTAETVANAVVENITTPLKVPETKVTSPDNLLTSDVVYNFRISPMRNAMRWFKYVVSSIKDYATTKLIFTSGEGNIKGKGQQFYDCPIEDTVLQEDSNIERGNFVDELQANPIYSQENITFEYPLTYNEFSAIFANPYGVVSYECRNGTYKQGWIDKLKYSPHDGIATFVLRPKIEL